MYGADPTVAANDAKQWLISSVTNLESLIGKVKTVGKLNAYSSIKILERELIFKNDFNGGKIKVRDRTYSTPHTVMAIPAEKVKVEAINQDYSGLFYSFKSWFDNNTINPRYFFTTKKKETFIAQYRAGVKIQFSNIDEERNNFAGTTLSIDNYGEVPSGSFHALPLGGNTTVTTNDATIESASILYKHNKWNFNRSEHKLSHSINIQTGIVKDEAVFKKITPAEVKASLDGVCGNIPVYIKDPWFVEQDGTQPGNWKSYSTGFTPSTMPNGGIFLNESYDPGNPYYTARVETDFYPNLNGSNAEIYKWTGPTGTIINPTALETPIVFRNTNDVILANYKGHLRTGVGAQNGQKNQRRMFVNNAGYPLMVYESMGEIWLTHAYQNNEVLDWSNEIRLSSGNGNASNPTISNMVQISSLDYGRIAIVWTENNQMKVQLLKLSQGAGDLTYGWQLTDFSFTPSETNNRVLDYIVPSPGSRPSVNLTYEGSDLVMTIAYEGKLITSGLDAGVIVNQLLFSSTIGGTYADVSNYFSFRQLGSGTLALDISPENNTSSAVVIRYPLRSSNAPAKNSVYFLSSSGSGTELTKVTEFNLDNGVKTNLSVPQYLRRYYWLSGECNYTSGGIGLNAYGQTYNYYYLNNEQYDTPISAIFTKSVNTSNQIPQLVKTYSGYRNSVIMVDQGAITSNPKYEVIMKPVSDSYWVKATGTSSVSFIQRSNVQTPFVSGRVPANFRNHMHITTATGPNKIDYYTGDGPALEKGGYSDQFDVRAYRTIRTSDNSEIPVILDFTGSLVEPQDELESGSVLCAVTYRSGGQSGFFVSRQDSSDLHIGMDIVRGGISVKSYNEENWRTLSVNSIADLSDGDILLFRYHKPFDMVLNYEDIRMEEGSLSKHVEGEGDVLESLTEGIRIYPNPFNPVTTFEISLKAPQTVRLAVYNLLGQQVSELVSGELGAGRHSFPFNGSNLSSGTYFYRLETAGEVKTGKLQLLK